MVLSVTCKVYGTPEFLITRNVYGTPKSLVACKVLLPGIFAYPVIDVVIRTSSENERNRMGDYNGDVSAIAVDGPEARVMVPVGLCSRERVGNE